MCRCPVVSRVNRKTKAEVFEFVFIVELPDLNGIKKLKEKGYSYYAQVSSEGE